MSNDFLDADYVVPKGDSDYMKLEQGDNKFRILSKPVLGWVDWIDKKPVRFPMDKKPEKPSNPKQPVRHFWAFPVWNYKANKVQVLEITLVGVQKNIQALAANAEWGSPLMYDLTINKTGTTKDDTKYNLMPSPNKGPAPKEALDSLTVRPCTLEKLFSNEDPFGK